MAKIKNVAIQMDHVSGINIAGDSTFAMSLEAQARGYRLFHYTPERLSMRDGKIYATVEQMELRDIKGDHFSLSEIRDLPGMEELKGAGLLSPRMPAGFSVPVPPSDPDLPSPDEDPLTDIDLEELGLLTPRITDD